MPTRTAGRRFQRGRHNAISRQAEDALQLLYASHYRGLYQLALLLAGDTMVAEKVTQEAFAAMHRAWQLLGTSDAALLYLHRQVIRRARSRQAGGRYQAGPQASPRPGADPAVAVTMTMLAGLSVRLREVVVLRYWAGLTDAQIAAITRSRLRAVADSASPGALLPWPDRRSGP